MPPGYYYTLNNLVGLCFQPGFESWYDLFLTRKKKEGILSEFFDVTDPIDHELHGIELSDLAEKALVEPEEYYDRHQEIAVLLANFRGVEYESSQVQDLEDGFTIFLSMN